MAGVLKISEATTLALHAMCLMAREPEKMLSTHEIASTFSVSESHLSKVLQRLNKARLIKSIRGPRGGFLLQKDARDITLLEIYELIEGPLDKSRCLLSHNVCSGALCVLGGVLENVNEQVQRYLSTTRLSDLENVFEEKGEKECSEQGR